MSFSELLKSAKETKAKVEPPSADVPDVVVGEALVTLRFRELPGFDWASLQAKFPLRLDTPIDRRYGYNVHAVSLAAAKINGVRVEGDDEFPLKVDAGDPKRKKPPVDEWEDLFTVLSGSDLARVVDAIWNLNEYLPQKRAEALKKASQAASRTNSDSPAT